MKLILKFGLAAIGLLLFMFRNAHVHTLKRQTLHLEAIQPFKPFKMVFISDIHHRVLPENLIDFPVDFIVIGGDIAEKGVPLRKVEHNLKVLSAAAPVYFIWGNNDREVDEMELRRLFSRYGVHLLENDSIELFGNSRLKLVGLDYFAFRENPLDTAFAGVAADDTVIFVSHTPFIFPRVMEHYPVDFVLAGHTHGGQIRIGKWGLYKKGSLTEENGVYRLVSNGYGTTHLPLRLGAEAEYHVLTIKPKESTKLI